MTLKWNDGNRNGTGLAGFFDTANVNAAIATFEAAAGVTGDWDWDDETGSNWWGLVGTYNGATFTLYTHKSGTIKIGAYDNEGLDLDGLKVALAALVAA